MRYSRKIILFVLMLLLNCDTDSENNGYVRVKYGDFISTITETGELQAVSSTTILSPRIPGFYEQPKVISLEKEGTLVKAGDIVAELDNAKISQRLIQKQEQLALEESNRKKQEVSQRNELKKLNADLLSKEADLRSAKLRLKQEEFETEKKKEISRLRLKIVEINLERAKRKIETTKQIHDEDRKITETKIKQIKRDIKQAENAIEAYKLKAPINGIVAYSKSWMSGKKIQIGDQLYWGMPVIDLPDLSKMKVITSANELDIGKVFIGQSALVRLDAFPKKEFKGSVISISNVSHNKDRESKIKIFDVEVLLDEIDDILRPGMTVSCEFVVSEIKDVMYINNDYVQQDGDEFYVMKGNDRTVVTLGPINNKYVVVYGDIEEGNKIFK